MKKLIILFIVISVSASGCATIIEGSYDTIDLQSEPNGAEVYINGAKKGVTPYKAKLKKGNEYEIEFKKAGFHNKNFTLTYSLGAGWLILDILFGLIGIAVDAGTGAWNGFETNYYKANLDKAPE